MSWAITLFSCILAMGLGLFVLVVLGVGFGLLLVKWLDD